MIASDDPPLLAAEGIGFSAGGKTIIENISLIIAAGEIRALVGANGAGKSTLARCLAGVAAGWRGRVAIAGRDRRSLNRREFAKLVCYLPQSSGTPPPFTVRNYVLMGRYAHGGFWSGLGREDGEKAESALELAGISGLADRLLPTLSGGERQLAAIAAGLAQESRLLILDEPSAFLDPARQELLHGILRRLNRERGVSILLVTHDINAAMLLTHRTIALRDGRTAFDGPSRDLAETGVLRRIYGLEFSFLEAGGARLVLPRSLTEPEQWV